MTAKLNPLAAAPCLMSYGPDFPTLFRLAVEYADKISRGTDAARRKTAPYVVNRLRTVTPPLKLPQVVD